MSHLGLWILFAIVKKKFQSVFRILIGLRTFVNLQTKTKINIYKNACKHIYNLLMTICDGYGGNEYTVFQFNSNIVVRPGVQQQNETI